ncbi:GNAT family N-acetyltransferase [Demequina gelatinilytica]|uniref:GNAT family N-acetyltransferase n=1 Tax=Demequina gelatinilytica TaxID=1638980 RepID=UPI000B033DDF|nr:GNAT family N-acetyltransferase [Demequina gelatinilytica]
MGYVLRRWTDADLPVLVAANAPEMMEHLAGPETDARVRRRHEQYIRGWDSGRPHMFTIRRDDAPVAVGSVGWWESDWDGEPCLETGWMVVPEHQRRGAATAGVRLLIDQARDAAAARGLPPVLMACPNVDNAASNALCRTVGFEHRGTLEDEYRGVPMTLNIWTYDLTEDA